MTETLIEMVRAGKIADLRQWFGDYVVCLFKAERGHEHEEFQVVKSEHDDPVVAMCVQRRPLPSMEARPASVAAGADEWGRIVAWLLDVGLEVEHPRVLPRGSADKIAADMTAMGFTPQPPTDEATAGAPRKTFEAIYQGDNAGVYRGPLERGDVLAFLDGAPGDWPEVCRVQPREVDSGTRIAGHPAKDYGQAPAGTIIEVIEP